MNDWLSVLGDVGGYWATSSTSRAAGGVVTSSGIQTSGWQDHFAMTAGGGIDIKVSRQFSIRLVQEEYFMTKIPDGLNNLQNNFLFSAGVSLLIGRK